MNPRNPSSHAPSRTARWLVPALVLAAVTTGLPIARAGVDSQVAALVRNADIRSTKVSLYAKDLGTNDVLVQLDPDEPKMPASNMKLLTTAAAVSTLGPDFMFKTELRLIPGEAWPPTQTPDGKILPPPGPSLAVIGDGDPAFCDNTTLAQFGGDINDLDKLLDIWINAIKATGIKHFDRLLVDDRVFDRQFTHPTWPADQLNRWYAAQVAGLNFNTNCFDVYPEPTSPGQSPRVSLYPESPFINTSNQAVTGNNDTFWVARKIGSNDLSYRGQIKSRRRVAINVTIHDPPIYFGQLLVYRLAKEGVTIDRMGRPDDDLRLPDGKTLHIVQTPILTALARCNKDSQNLYAESLLKRMGKALTGSPGSFESGAAAERVFLNKALGADSSIIQIADGSGLSRDNRVTARAIVDLLDYMQSQNRTGEVYLNSLSIGGEDGTLDKRFDPNMASTVYGKSGYIAGVSTLSGYLVLGEGDHARTIAFSLLFNNIDNKVPLYRIKSLQDQVVKLLDRDLSQRAATPQLGG
ncbi:MAG: D-alanyl-D-alanine carboxypeptidase/D-alanyl-D-alanine-endopeptidase [Phycisphaera sp.]|nr:D-alanyl-D-alanine carboxypeptidase/D-alanyl-D-alanine-endopeptidase [Phycisphaera sp.]